MNQKCCFILILLAFIVILSAFQFDDAMQQTELRDTATITFVIPANIPEPGHIAPVSKKRFELGRVLFYDPLLSSDGTVSCGSCHQASAAFANLGSALSTGVNHCKGNRNAPPLFNLAWQKEFMWDGRINNLTAVPANAITNPCEMGNRMDAVLAVLNRNSRYRDKFKAVLGKDKMTEDDFLDVLGTLQ